MCRTILRYGVTALLVLASPVASPQTLLREVYTNIPGTSVLSLTTASRFPDAPDLRTDVGTFEAPSNFSGNYGTRIRGYVLPPTTGDYTFWIASDDQSELHLSLDASPENRRLIARVNASTGAREWTREAAQQSALIPLEAGHPYYVEALHKEGSGNDHLAVGWQLPEGTFERPIPGIRLRPWILHTTPPVITQEPADAVVSEEDSTSFFVQATGAEPLSFQWQRDAVNLDRETGPLLLIEALSLSDSGAGFRCIVTNHLGSTTSRVARLTVYAETNPPTVTVLNPPPGATVRHLLQVEVVFSEPVTGLEAEDLFVNNQPATALTGAAAGPWVFSFPAQPPGLATLTWRVGHGIRDLSAASNTFSGGTWNVQVDPGYGVPSVVITEFLTANEHGLRDENGEMQDWIEIQNRSPQAVDLAGWSLSDDANNPGLWTFPTRVLAPGRFLIVFASGKDRRPSGGTNALHSNFKLSADGEPLGLYAPGVPRFATTGFENAYPEQRIDFSYGLDPAGQWRYFTLPTPGASNGFSTITTVVEPVHCSVERGLFNKPFGLTLFTPTPGAEIRYTTNGAEPTLTNGLRYTAPLTIRTTTVFRAAAFLPGHLPSRTVTHSYFFGLSPALTSLPVLSLVTATNHLLGPTGIMGVGGGFYSNNGVWYPLKTNDYHNPSKRGIEWERPVSAELIHPTHRDGFQIDCGIRVHGDTYIRPRLMPTSKFSYRLYFRGDYGAGRLEYPLFANSHVTSFNELVLRAGMNDRENPFIRDELVRRLAQDMGRVEVHGTFANLFINGEYKGYYNPTERVRNAFLQSYHGGGDNWDVLAEGNEPQEGDTIEWNSFRNYVNTADVTRSNIFVEIERRFDVTNFVDYLLLKHITGAGDWPHNNWRVGRERGPSGVLRFYLWDDEWAWGYNSRLPTLSLFTNELAGTTEVATLYKRFKLNPEFRQMWIDRAHKHYFNGGALMDANIVRRHNELSNVVRSVIAGFNPTIVVNWLPLRRTNVLNQFHQEGLLGSSNAPALSQHGGRVPPGWRLSMTNLAGTIYFTTNGADPRVRFSGAVAPGAQVWTNGATLPLFASTRVKARSLNGSAWSAVTEAEFIVGTLGVPIRFAEIMYNPLGGDAFEFIELRNLSATPVDLSGFRLTGVTYQFPTPFLMPAGGTVLLAASVDPAAFAARYPGVTVHGRFSGSLANGGERLALLDRDGRIVCSLDYDDEAGWTRAADGAGPSLQMLDLYGDLDDPANWNASAQPAGSPGVPDHFVPTAPVVRLNELAALNTGSVTNGPHWPDWIELHNAGPVPVDLTDWSLTDDGNERKFVLPPGRSLAPGDFLVIWCDTNRHAPGLHTGFALDANGESVSLFNAQTSRVDAITFGRQLADHTIGRVGLDWLLTDPTPGASNVAAATAAITNLVINEWMANPLAGQDDWLELHNRHTNKPVALRGLYVGNGESTDAIRSLSFVGPGGFLVLHADENPGPDHLDFRLPATGSALVLFDPTGVEFHRVTNAVQSEGVSRGRTPDGSATISDFPGEATPGSANAVLTPPAVSFNEVLALNRRALTNPVGRFTGFFELLNPSPTNVNLAGYGVSLGNPRGPQWLFPSGVAIAPDGTRAVWADPASPASTAAGTWLNFGQALPPRGGTLYLFGPTGRLLDSVAYGLQLADRSVGFQSAAWRLLSQPTPDATNAPVAALGPATALRLNEWMVDPAQGADWFELFNTTNLPVSLGGLYLSDDPSLAGQSKFRIPALTFVDAHGFVTFVADGDPTAGPDHVNFQLEAEGESLFIADTSFRFIDAVWLSAQQPGVSEGRLPDGASEVAAFPETPSPDFSNWRPLQNVVFNEVLARADPPLEQAIELHNLGSTPLDVGQWTLSDDLRQLQKFLIPPGTALAPNGFTVFYQDQFANGANAFVLDPVSGGELWLSATDGAGKRTGLRTRIAYGAATTNGSQGRVWTSLGADFAALTRPTFGVDNPASEVQFRAGRGQSNAPPLVGPVVVSEIMFHSAPSTFDDEFIELHNASTTAVPLFDPAQPLHTWRLSHAVEFAFPLGVTLAPGEWALVVNFDPVAEPSTLGEFRANYSVPSSVRIFGPFTGRLANEGEAVKLCRPDAPPSGAEPDRVPWLVVDRVVYGREFPWPTYRVDGGGYSLQRRGAALYGNEALNWASASPTPGTVNTVGIHAPPLVTQHPTNVVMAEGQRAELRAEASGAEPLFYQWRQDGRPLPDQTQTTLVLPSLSLAEAGRYDVVVFNHGGVVFSSAATLTVLAPPRFTLTPLSQTVASNATAVFAATVVGTEPLRYRWSFNGTMLPGATLPTLMISNANYPHIGAYTLTAANDVGSASASAQLQVLVAPIILQQPQSQTRLEGQAARFSLVVTGAPPFGFRWRRNGTTVVPFGVAESTYTIPNLQLSNAGNYTVVITNLANPVPGVLSSSAVLTVLADFDRDALPDAWETEHRLNTHSAADAWLDADGDTLSNYAEYVAGTDPQAAQSRLRVERFERLPDGAHLLQFQAVSNRSYVVQSGLASALGSGVWTNAGVFDARATNWMARWTNSAAAHGGFYRLWIPPEP